MFHPVIHTSQVSAIKTIVTTIHRKYSLILNGWRPILEREHAASHVLRCISPSSSLKLPETNNAAAPYDDGGVCMV